MSIKVDAVFSSLSLIEIIFWYFWLSTSIYVVSFVGGFIFNRVLAEIIQFMLKISGIRNKFLFFVVSPCIKDEI